MIIESLLASDLRQSEILTLRSLTMRNMGSMEGRLKIYLSDPDPKRHQIFVARKGRKTIGWALLWRYQPEREWNLYIYVDKKYRRQGVGTTLARYARKSARRKLRVHPWDDQSTYFYSNLTSGDITIL